MDINKYFELTEHKREKPMNKTQKYIAAGFCLCVVLFITATSYEQGVKHGKRMIAEQMFQYHAYQCQQIDSYEPPKKGFVTVK